MKNIAIAGCLVVGLLLVMSVSGSAQVSRQYTAHVPFDFSVRNRLMKAGDYTIGPASGTTNERAIALLNRSTGKIAILGEAVVGSSQEEAKGTMTFEKGNDDGWVLQTIDTPGFGIKLKKNKNGVRIVASANDAPESKTIILQN